MRRGLAIVDRGVLATGAVDHHETAAADIAGTRIGHGHGEADRDRRVHRVAALLQNLDADACRARLLRHHHAVFGDNALRDKLRIRTVVVAERDDGQGERANDATDATKFTFPVIIKSQHRRQDPIGRPMAVQKSPDVDDDLLAHVDATLERGRAEMRQQHDLAGAREL